MQYKPKGVCSRMIHFDIENDKVINVAFTGGCSGNLQGIARLIEGIHCGYRSTSCPDQLAKALKEATGN